MEVQKSNPSTTIKIHVESEPNLNSATRQFKRIYICLGPLKQGFRSGMRDLIGLDGAFMKGPFPGQVLTAVGLDGNNSIYPVAYAIVEAETLNSWTWFLECLMTLICQETLISLSLVIDKRVLFLHLQRFFLVLSTDFV